MAHTHARTLIASRLTLVSYCAARVVVPLLVYIPLSLSFTLISVAFGLPFGGKYVHSLRSSIWFNLDELLLLMN